MAGRIGLATAGSILPAGSYQGSGAFVAGQPGGGREEAAEVDAQERRIDALAAGELLTEEGLAAGEEAEVEAEARAERLTRKFAHEAATEVDEALGLTRKYATTEQRLWLDRALLACQSQEASQSPALTLT